MAFRRKRRSLSTFSLLNYFLAFASLPPCSQSFRTPRKLYRKLYRKPPVDSRPNRFPAPIREGDYSVWREVANPALHTDYMSSCNYQGVPVSASPDPLVEKWVYLVRVDATFVLQFNGLEQVGRMRQYLRKKVHPSTKNAGDELEHLWHPWYCKLPKKLTSKSKKSRVLKRLDRVLYTWGDQRIDSGKNKNKQRQSKRR